MTNENIETFIEKKKKRLPLPLKIALIPVFAALAVLVLIIAWCVYSVLNKVSAAELIPPEFTAYLRTDNVFGAVDPLADLKAADELLADPKLAAARPALVEYRKSPLRQSRFVRFAGRRRLDAAWYGDTDFVAVVNMGVFSAVTRLMPLAAGRIPMLSYVQENGSAWFEYHAGQNLTLYIKPIRNAVAVASTKEHLAYVLGKNRGNVSPSSQKKKSELIETRLEKPFRIAGDVDKLLDFAGTNVSAMQKELLYQIVPRDALVSASFGISDSDLNLHFDVPLLSSTEGMLPDSSNPAITKLFGEATQYYTLLNLADLEQIKESVFPLLPLVVEGQNFDSLWNSTETACRLMFRLSMEDLLFSWTGKEMAVIGLEGKQDPVFVMQVTDEKKRQRVFDSIISSIIIHEDNSLILDGVRLPRLQMPVFFQKLLRAFGIDMVKPYYLVRDGYIFFSVSPENLIAVHNGAKTNARLINTDNYKHLSKEVKATSLTLYYNLERSMPFFLRSSTAVTRILRMYNLGRADLQINGRMLEINLNSTSRENTSVLSVAGYPVPLKNDIKGTLCKSNGDKSTKIFWLERNNELVVHDVLTGSSDRTQLPASAQIVSAAKGTKNGTVWAVTADGDVYLFDDNLKLAPDFPVHIEGAAAIPCVYKNKLIVPAEEGFAVLESTSTSWRLSKAQVEYSGNILSAPTVHDNVLSFYSKRLLGSVIMVKNLGESGQSVVTLPVAGIAFGSPALLAQKKNVYTAFITQAGQLNVWDSDGQTAKGFPLQLEGVFYSNVVAADGIIYAINEDGVLYSVSLGGDVTSVQIPDTRAQEARLTLAEINKDKTNELFVSGDSDSLYGFDSKLELLGGFPVAGHGVPVFYDINGNGRPECIVPSLNKTLGAWRIN